MAAAETFDLDASLDAEIQRVRDEISSLRSRKSALTTSLLTNPSNPLLNPGSTNPNPTNPLVAAATPFERPQLLVHAKSAFQNLTLRAHQLFSGISIFDPAHPFPEQPIPSKLGTYTGRNDVLGLQFERFDQIERKFGAPAFLILAGEGAEAPLLSGDVAPDALFGAGSDGQITWRVLAHDLPGWIGVEGIADEYLSFVDDDDDEEEDVGSENRRSGKGLRAFARQVQGELVAGLRRHEVVMRLQEKLPRGWRQVRASASDAREVSIEWEDGKVGRLVLNSVGRIERAVVVDERGKVDEVASRDMMRKGTIMNLAEDGG